METPVPWGAANLSARSGGILGGKMTLLVFQQRQSSLGFKGPSSQSEAEGPVI